MIVVDAVGQTYYKAHTKRSRRAARLDDTADDGRADKGLRESSSPSSRRARRAVFASFVARRRRAPRACITLSRASPPTAASSSSSDSPFVLLAIRPWAAASACFCEGSHAPC